jgi:ornithine carbamoyltransferase
MKEEAKHFLSITDLSAEEIWQVFSVAKQLKYELKSKGENEPLLKNKYMVMLFEKPSLRTKLSFDIGFKQLGGHVAYFGGEEVGLGKRETVSDAARVISSQANLIVARVNTHKTVEELVKGSSVPVINALSDLEHPCQVLTDLFTIWETKKYQELDNLTIGYVGDGDNNVAHSLCLGSAMLNLEFRCGAHKEYSLDPDIVKQSRSLGGTVIETEDPKVAVAGVDVVVTDTWISMGDGNEVDRMEKLKAFQVNSSLMKYAKPDAIFMHCLPAHRNNEVTDEVIDGPQSVVFQEAENRLHLQKALILYLLGKA